MPFDAHVAHLGQSDIPACLIDPYGSLLIVGGVALNRIFPTLERGVTHTLVPKEIPKRRLQMQLSIAKGEAIYLSQPFMLQLEPRWRAVLHVSKPLLVLFILFIAVLAFS